jgi:hypothetical protein
MKKNLHLFDRIARMLFAFIVAILYFTGSITGTLAIVLSVTAAVLAATALINFCPIYYMLGISTRNKFQKQ